jgi:60 kDa SS-A/Ro ribonucleoprotein
LRDVMFLTHPKPDSDEQAAVWKQLVEGALPSPDTWEVALSTGQDKRETWVRLLAEGKLGGLAMLRNLRNMIDANVPEEKIKVAMSDQKFWGVLPHQFIAAARNCPALEPAIDAAMQRALLNLPKLKGRTTLLVDVSGSMDGAMAGPSKILRVDAAAAVAILLAGVAEDLAVFSFSTSTVRVPARQGMALAEAIVRSQPHGGTYMGAAVKSVDHGDSLIVISDEQSHDDVPVPKVRAYMINVASAENGVGYGKWTHIDGFSAQCVKWIQQFEDSE